MIDNMSSMSDLTLINPTHNHKVMFFLSQHEMRTYDT